MSVFAWLLWILFRGTLGGPVQHATWSEGGGLNPVQTPQHEATNPSFYYLPMFQHARGPLVSPELFRPVLQKSPLPTGLNALLFPQARPEHSVTGTGSRAVHVWCGFDDISVRVDRLHLRTWTDPSLFRLGSCPVSRVSPRFLYFHHRLSDCGGEPQVVGGQLVYSYALSYTPPQQGYVIRVVPLHFPIYCNYNRFHYSYQVGFRPQVQHTTLMKSIRSKLSYSLTVSNAQGEPVPSGHWFFLGEPVYFVAQAAALLAGERLYVDSCYATSSSDPHSVHRAEIITNYGCMPDSRRVGSSSRFLLGGGSVLKFSVDAFLFREVSQVLYLHCSMSVGLTTSYSSKSCSYDQAAGRWEELTAAASVCSCCDSMCGNIHQSIKNTVSSPGLLISQRSDVKPRRKEMSLQAEEARDWEDPEEKLEEEKDENHKEVQTFPQETEEEEASPKKTNQTKAWRTSDVVTQQGNEEEEDVGETEAVMDETDSQLKEFSTEDIMSDQSTPEEFSSTENASVSGLSSDNISTDASENVSTAALPTSELCADGDPKSCSTSINSAAGGTQSFTPDTVVGATNRSGSLWESDIRDFETVGKHSATGDLGMDIPGLFNISRLEADQIDSLLWSEQSDWIQGQAEDADRSEGAYGDDDDDDDDDMLHSVQSRESDSEQHAHPAGFRDTTFVHRSLGKPDFDSGAEERVKSHLTGEEQTKWQEEYFSDATTRPHGVSSLSLEDMHEDSPSHSAVVIISSALQGSVSSLPADSDWADMEPAPGLHSLGFVEEWPVEEFQQKLMDDFYQDEINYQKSSNTGLLWFT
ncbi:Zona pellucida sperm-binding protein 3 [Dissostichus eleginoides]|uniref:Zona pellucida sperm-binding protein 3 n=1 Tax=Dissostichus eleginoides TaxID=100907 RepID=A0AAD9C620_DISEL|nr:Zona pellucida sperm-binding protein 3 [Dissostichus eleginoides]